VLPSLCKGADFLKIFHLNCLKHCITASCMSSNIWGLYLTAKRHKNHMALNLKLYVACQSSSICMARRWALWCGGMTSLVRFIVMFVLGLGSLWCVDSNGLHRLHHYVIWSPEAGVLNVPLFLFRWLHQFTACYAIFKLYCKLYMLATHPVNHAILHKCLPMCLLGHLCCHHSAMNNFHSYKPHILTQCFHTNHCKGQK
jgi:hypothetical protein